MATREKTIADGRVLAAVDLGSNSFHMVVARVVHGQLRVVDRLQEMVRLAAGLDAKGRLDKAARKRALDCLQRFGQRLRGIPAGSVRVVGTNTLRRARKSDTFSRAARAAIGHPIEIISGVEEARIIYRGVAYALPRDTKRRLVVDIGGGSTEIVIGKGLDALDAESLYMGCVGFSETYFAGGQVSEKRMRRAETAARLELQPIADRFRGGWSYAAGASGTVKALASIARMCGWTRGELTAEALTRIRTALLRVTNVRDLRLPGLSDQRRPVLAGGLAVTIALFETLRIERLRVSENALREGLLVEMLGRLKQSDVREQTIRALSQRYHVDAAQAGRVAATAARCLSQVARQWRIGDDDARALDWAARLHEIGLAIAHVAYHKHGAYVAQNSDLAGFTRREQELLALLVRSHRRKFPVRAFAALDKGRRTTVRRLAALLRLAVLLHRARVKIALPEFRCIAAGDALTIIFPRGWLAAHPLTRADLDQEEGFVRVAKIRLVYR